MSGVRCTVDLEWWYHAIIPQDYWLYYETTQSVATTYHLMDLLRVYNVHATFYVLGVVAKAQPGLLSDLCAQGHRLGSHGWAHHAYEREDDGYDEDTRRYLPECVGYRAPYWRGTPRPGYGGGAFFRLLPYPIVKWEVQRSGELYLHPHDLDLHPSMLRRSVSVGEPWQKLERLLSELQWF